MIKVINLTQRIRQTQKDKYNVLVSSECDDTDFYVLLSKFIYKSHSHYHLNSAHYKINIFSLNSTGWFNFFRFDILSVIIKL